MKDWWTCHQFDSAVIWGGMWIENKLNEFDKEGKPVHKLKDLLEPALTNVQVIRLGDMPKMPGVIYRKND